MESCLASKLHGLGCHRSTWHLLATGNEVQQDPSAADARPPLLFVHGSYHAAWCWAEKWMPCQYTCLLFLWCRRSGVAGGPSAQNTEAIYFDVKARL
eukprot:1154027-Pelagomonas_calceolata.AAC.4